MSTSGQGTLLIFCRSFNDGKQAAIVRCLKSTKYWVTSATYARTLDKNLYAIIETTLSMT